MGKASSGHCRGAACKRHCVGDVHPGNIAIDKNFDAWIVDFGGGWVDQFVDRQKSGTKEGNGRGFEESSKSGLFNRLSMACKETNYNLIKLRTDQNRY